MDVLKSLPPNFVAKLEFSGECWLWRGGTSGDGYGRFKYERRMVSAHRLAYELVVGTIPKGKELDHLCRNRACCNPVHLDPVTCRTNLLRGETAAAANVRKTHCPAGHPYDAENTYLRADRPGTRDCKKCRNNAAREYQRRRRARASGITYNAQDEAA